MRRSKKYTNFLRIGIALLANLPLAASAQEPNFSQFIASPLSINPALAGTSDADWRIISNIRRQWIGNISPYSTQTVSIDGKLKNLSDQSYFGIGGMVLAEKAMDGLYKSNFVHLNASYHQALDDNGNGISAALGVVNNSTRVDLVGLTFDQQLSSSGFNQALPIAETNIGTSTGFTSATAGLLYTYDAEFSFLNIGISGYRFIKTRRSLMNDPAKKISPRYTAHADFGTAINETINASLSAVHMIQDGMSVTSLGAIMGIQHGEGGFEENKMRMVNFGLYYRVNDAVTPYVGYVFNGFQFGLSYDVNASSSKTGAVNYKSVELSFMYKKYLPTYRRKVGRYNSPY
jgi:type IX secretion system PorP/SprF family membrane protein